MDNVVLSLTKLTDFMKLAKKLTVNFVKDSVCEVWKDLASTWQKLPYKLSYFHHTRSPISGKSSEFSLYGCHRAREQAIRTSAFGRELFVRRPPGFAAVQASSALAETTEILFAEAGPSAGERGVRGKKKHSRTGLARTIRHHRTAAT